MLQSGWCRRYGPDRDQVPKSGPFCSHLIEHICQAKIPGKRQQLACEPEQEPALEAVEEEVKARQAQPGWGKKMKAGRTCWGKGCRRFPPASAANRPPRLPPTSRCRPPRNTSSSLPTALSWIHPAQHISRCPPTLAAPRPCHPPRCQQPPSTPARSPLHSRQGCTSTVILKQGWI